MREVRVLVFGVFDGIHPGHRALFAQAGALGDRLIAVTTHDHVVLRLKGHLPRRTAGERLATLRAEPGVDDAVLGDPVPGTWSVVEQLAPDIIALGYDQHALRADLERFLAERGMEVDVRVMSPHRPDRFHTTLLEPTPEGSPEDGPGDRDASGNRDASGGCGPSGDRDPETS